MISNPNEWCTIESDPGVFSQLVSDLGVKDVSVEEVFSLEDKIHLQNLSPIHGLIFLFRWDNKTPYKPDRTGFPTHEVFFAKQVIKDNCATQALLSVLFNSTSKITLGDKLDTFLDFSKGLDPYNRGLAIGQSEHIRNVHNSFAKPDKFLFVNDPNDKGPKKTEDAFHFVSYMKSQTSNKVFELDGLRNGPILLGEEEEGKDWIDLVIQEINQRIQHYTTNEIR